MCAFFINLTTSTLSHLRIAMAPGTPGSQPAVFDGLQVVENSERAEKYPARRHGDSKYLTSTDDGGLHLVAGEHPLKQYKATQASRPRDGGARRRSRECKFWILLTILPLIVVGACVGGVLGSRAVKAHSNQYDDISFCIKDSKLNFTQISNFYSNNPISNFECSFAGTYQKCCGIQRHFSRCCNLLSLE